MTGSGLRHWPLGSTESRRGAEGQLAHGVDDDVVALALGGPLQTAAASAPATRASCTPALTVAIPVPFPSTSAVVFGA